MCRGGGRGVEGVGVRDLERQTSPTNVSRISEILIIPVHRGRRQCLGRIYW